MTQEPHFFLNGKEIVIQVKRAFCTVIDEGQFKEGRKTQRRGGEVDAHHEWILFSSLYGCTEMM